MEAVIQILKNKKSEIASELDPNNEISVMASNYLFEQIDKAIWTLEYEYYWKHLTEKQIDEKMGIRKIGR